MWSEGARFGFAAIRRYEAAAWLRKIIGVVGAKDLPAEPSEDEFRLGLRSGIILCNVLNKLQPGAVPKVNLNFPLMATKVSGLKLGVSGLLFVPVFLPCSVHSGCRKPM